MRLPLPQDGNFATWCDFKDLIQSFTSFMIQVSLPGYLYPNIRATTHVLFSCYTGSGMQVGANKQS